MRTFKPVEGNIDNYKSKIKLKHIAIYNFGLIYKWLRKKISQKSVWRSYEQVPQMINLENTGSFLP